MRSRISARSWACFLLPRVPLEVEHRVPGNLVVLGGERVAELDLVAFDVELPLGDDEVLVDVELDVGGEADLELQLQHRLVRLVPLELLVPPDLDLEAAGIQLPEARGAEDAVLGVDRRLDPGRVDGRLVIR
jgi:hypothetical protein